MDARRRAAPAGVGRPARTRRSGYATRAMRDLLRLLLERVPAVCLFVRAENTPAIRLYETVGMRARARLSERPLLRRAPARAPRARAFECRTTASARPSGRRALRAWRRGGARAARGARLRADRARRRDAARPDAGDARRSRSGTATSRGSSARPRRDRLRLVRGRRPRRVPHVGMVERAGCRSARAAARAGSRRRRALRRRARRAARPARGRRPRGLARASDPVRARRVRRHFPAARIEHVPHATPFRLDAGAVERAAETLRVWAAAPRFVDLGYAPRRHTTAWTCSRASRRTSARTTSSLRGARSTCLVSGGADSTCLWHALGALGYGVARRPRPPRAPRRGGRRGRRALPRRRSAPRSSRRRRRRREAETARPALLADRAPRPARDGAHGQRPGRDASSTGSSRAGRRAASACAARTASSGRCSRSGARRRRRTAASTASRGAPTRRTADTKRGLIRERLVPLLEELDPRARANLLAVANGRPRLPRRLEASLVELLSSLEGTRSADLGGGVRAVRVATTRCASRAR